MDGAPKNVYLILYNLVCCSGWATILFLACPTIINALSSFSLKAVIDALSSIYGLDNGGLATTLIWVQCAALLEIVHASVGLVRSPVFVTSLQVGSRIAALFALVHSSTATSEHYGAGLMILSWALVEVPRYAFYIAAIAAGDATKKTPYPLFWLRYSLFWVLYPTGILGELTVYLAASKDPTFLSFLGKGRESLMYYFIMSFPVIYAPGALPMILNMAANRKAAFKKRFAKPPPPPRGLVWPLLVDSKKPKSPPERSSTPTAKAILAAAIGAVNEEKAENVRNLRNWRFGYVKHFVEMVKEQCTSPEVALTIAETGLAKAHSIFEFIKPDGTSCSFADAMSSKNEEKFYTGFIQGQKDKTTNTASSRLEVPYKGKTLYGEELKAQVMKWVDYGTIEPSAGDAICKCVDNPKWLDLSDKYFVLLGAGSAMGPFLVLMALGANIIAIDLDRPHIWKRLIEIAQASCGTITFPMKIAQDSCNGMDDIYASSGCNLFTQTPIIKDWLLELYPGKPFTVGSYAYLDGALHVQVSLAMDAICAELSEKRPNTSLAYLCTPTDLHLVPKEAHEAAKEQHKIYSKKLFCMLMNFLSRGKFLRKNVMTPIVSVKDGSVVEYYAVNGLSVAQGPNYCLAKRMQHWRAIVARNRGCIVSSNIAPATSTVSVVHNRTFAWAYEGMPYFKPYEIFAPETSNAVMSALLLFDLNDPSSVGNPVTKLNNPNQLFSYGSFNGGAWRCAYEVDSIGECSVLIYFARLAKPYITVVTGIAALGAAMAWQAN